MRDPIYQPNEPFRHVYFPETAVGSILTVLDDATEIEVATIGQEGVLGLPVILGARTSPGKAFWQVPGKTWRLDASVLRAEMKNGGAVAAALHIYIQAFFTQLAQAATCNRVHKIDQRCARWLLMTHDRVEGDNFPLTQEFLAQMLGVRRTGVPEVAGRLQEAGLIEYRRGRITVLNREGLEKASCECYRIVRAEFDRLLG